MGVAAAGQRLWHLTRGECALVAALGYRGRRSARTCRVTCFVTTFTAAFL